MDFPTLRDVYAARARIRGVLSPTPLIRHPLLEAEVGCVLHVKHENHHPTGAFKVRGGLNLVAALTDDERQRGVMTASTGNHGQSIAFACQRRGVACTVVVPLGNNPDKNAAMRAYGADVIEHGRDFDEAREFVEAACARDGRRYVHSANEPLLIAGVATCALEIFEALPHVDVAFVPIGGGSGAAGLALVRTAVGARTRVIGVQAHNADAFTRSWRGAERIVGERAETLAEGVATRVTFDLTFNFLKRELDDIVLLSEDELAEGVRLALGTTHNLLEGAGAASLMAAVKMKDQLAGKTVVCVATGANIDARRLGAILGHA